MTILLSTPRYSPYIGGIETLMRQLLPELRARGHEMIVVAGTDTPDEQSDFVDDIPVYRLPLASALLSAEPSRMFAQMQRLRAIEAEHDVSARHIHGIDVGNLFLWREQCRRPLPFVVTVHGILDDHPMLDTTPKMLRSADVVTAISEAVRDSLTRTQGELGGRIVTIRNGLAPSPLPPTPWRDTGRFVMAGRLDPQKGFGVAIEALARVRDTHPHARLVIAGGGLDEEPLRKKCAAHRLTDHVTFLGVVSRDDVAAQISDASAAVVPSLTIEGFGLVALEAGQLGRPVIATAVGGLPEIVRDGENGVLVPPGDPDALAAAMIGLLDDPQRSSAMGERARAIAAEFDFATCVDQYDALYRELEARAGSSRPPVSAYVRG